MRKHIYFCVVLASLFCLNVFSDGNFKKTIDKAAVHIEKKQYKNAVRILEKALKSKDMNDSQKGEIILTLSKVYRFQNKPSEALRALESFTGAKPQRYQLEQGEAFFAIGEFDRALDCSSRYNKEEGLIFVEASWLRARSNLKLARYEGCINNCDQLVEISWERISAISTDLGKDEKKFLEEMIEDAGKLKGEALEKNDILLYGRDFALYRKAGIARFNGKYDDAIISYSQIQEGTLGDAARVYEAACYAKKGDIDTAIKMDRAFCEQRSFSLYRGEALYNLAFLLCVKKRSKSAMLEALALTEKCVDWCGNFKTGEALLKGINESLMRDVVNKTPNEFFENDDCGNLIRTKTFPESINNPKTSPWYLPYYEAKSGLLRGFLLSETGKKNEAALAFRKAVSGNGETKIVSNSGVFPELLEGLVQGFYLLPEECGRKISRKYKLKTKMAGFFIITEEYETAGQLLTEAQQSMRNEDKYDICATNLCRAYMLLRTGKAAEAKEILESDVAFFKEGKSELSRKAKYLYAVVLSSDSAQKAKAAGLYGELYKDENGYLANEAMLSLAMLSYNTGDKKTAGDLCGKLKRKKDCPYSAAARTMIKAIGKTKDAEIGEDGLETETGNVIRHSKTVVIPGTPSWDISASDLKSGDIIFYNIRCVSRDNCKIIRSFTLGLSPDEPQPPRAEAGQLEFVRIPALYVKNLKYNFKEIFPELAN